MYFLKLLLQNLCPGGLSTYDENYTNANNARYEKSGNSDLKKNHYF